MGTLEKVKEIIFNLLDKIKGVFSDIVDSVASKLDHLEPGKRRLVLACGGGVAALLLLIIILAASSGRTGDTGSRNFSVSLSIPLDELFFPDEPDFLPEFLLEREPRLFWSIDDIRPYWRIPGNNEFWQGQVRSAVDSLMEGIP